MATKIVKFTHTQEIAEKIQQDVSGASSVTISPSEEVGYANIEITYIEALEAVIMCQLINVGIMHTSERMNAIINK